MLGAEERRLRRIDHTPQGGAIEGNAADDALMVNQGEDKALDKKGLIHRFRQVFPARERFRGARSHPGGVSDGSTKSALAHGFLRQC